MPRKPKQSKPEEKPLIVGNGNQPVSSEPDEFTKTNPIFIDGGAPNQIFKFKRFGISYGTDDKAHAAAIILSILIGLLLFAIFLIGAFVERSWITDALKILGTAFTFTIGVAIGQGTSSKKNNRKESSDSD